jgi:hypothetical protein
MMTLRDMQDQVIEAIIPFVKAKAMNKPEVVEFVKFDFDRGCFTFRGKADGEVNAVFRVYPYDMSVYEIHKDDRETEWGIGNLI